MVMNKNQLTNFITKYTLGGEIKSTKWTSNGDSLSTRFISGDKSVVGRVVLSKFSHLLPCELGVYNTGQLSSLLSVLGDDIDINLSQSGDKFISIKPSKLSLDIDFQLKYQNQIIGNQRNKINVYEDDLQEIFNSRTFCLYEDIEAIKKNGLAKGGSLENAIVVKDQNILNPEGLRNSKEFVNHKILDCIGDLFTSGYRMIASINCSQGGHFMTNSLLRKVFENKENFSIIEIQERTLPHTLINRSLLRSIA